MSGQKLGPLTMERMWSAMTTVAQIGSRDPHIVCVNLPRGQYVDLNLEAAMAWGRLFAAAQELRDSLREMVDRFESADEEPGYVTRARAALAKADGK